MTKIRVIVAEDQAMVLGALAAGMAAIPDYFAKLCRASGASVDRRQADGNYPFPGTKTFGYVSISHVPDFDAERAYPFVSSYVPIHRAAGVRLIGMIGGVCGCSVGSG